MKDQVVKTNYKIAVALLRQEKFDEAVLVLLEVVKLDPGHFKAFSNLGVAYKNLKRIKEEIKANEKAMKELLKA